MAAATIAQYDITWASDTSWGGMVEMLIRDAAAWDRNDDLFPFLRSYDIYAGHSWAGGHGCTNDGNNQESSSESLNFAAAVALWGSVKGDDEIRDLGIYLYTNEYTAVEQYWFDVDNEVFPVSFSHNCVGMVWGTGGVHSTWFSGEPEMIHGINFLPLTSASMYLGRNTDYVTDNYNEMVAENGGAEDVWYDIMWEYLALANPDLALSKFNDYPAYPVEGGETRAHTYYWLHNLKSMGQIDLSVTADVPNYGVFINNGIRTYAAYNPSFSAVTVHFSDGEMLDVPARQLASSNSVLPPQAPYAPIDFENSGYGADWDWEVFDNNYNPSLEIISNPYPTGANTSSIVAQFTALQAGQPWASCATTHGQDIGEFSFNEDNCIVKIMVYKSVISDVGLKFHASDGTSSGDIKVTNTLINQWEELTFDFSEKIGETNDQLVVFPDYDTDGREQTNIIYFDNITFSGLIQYDAPPVAADVPSHNEIANGVISIYSDSYTNITGVNYNPAWGQSTIVTTESIAGNEMLKYANLNFQGTDWNGNPQDISNLEYLHVDFWTANSTELGIYLVSGVFPTHTEVEYDFNITLQQWNSVEIPLSHFSNGGVSLADVRQFKVEGDGDIWIDNMYFWKPDDPANDDATLSDLLVDGVTVAGFSPTAYDYDVELPAGTTVVPTVTAVTNDVNASHIVTDAASLPGTTDIVVTAEDDTTVLTYSVNFTIASENEPTTAAPVPTEPEENVISLFSNVYSNVTVDTWSAVWDQADVTDVQVAGDDVKLYTNLNYAGIEFTSQTIDGSSMDNFHLDVWTPDITSVPSVFKVKLVDFGANGTYGGGDDLEHEIIFDSNTMDTGTWISLDIPMSDFTNLTTVEHLAQLLISGDPNTIYVDNIYFYTEITHLDAPENVAISISLSEVVLSWSAVSGAASYKVYSSDDPYTGFEEDTSGTFNSESWSTSIGDIKKFYYVKASTEEVRIKGFLSN